MATPRYILSKRERVDGRREIYVRYAISRTKYVQLHTGAYVKERLFAADGTSGGNTTGEIVIPKRGRLNNSDVREAQEAKARVQEFCVRLARVHALCAGVLEDRKAAQVVIDRLMDVPLSDINTQRIQEARIEKKAERVTIYQHVEAYLTGKDEAYKRHFRSIMRIVHRWEAYRREIEGEAFEASVESITKEDIEDLRDYISDEAELAEEHVQFYERVMRDYPAEIGTKHKKAAIKQRGGNAIHKMMKYLKTFWTWMNEQGVTSSKPFDGVKIGTEKYGMPFYLTIEERNQIADYDLSARPQLAVQRDIFVFQCLVGCRVGDLYKLTEANITNGVLEYVPNKTKDRQEQAKPRIPLTARAQALIIKYRGKDSKGRLFPFISEQCYNDAIKAVLKECGIDRNVIVRNSLTGENEIRPIYEVASSHMARRTFVGAAYSKVKDPNIVGRMSGHTEGSRAFARYRNIDDEILMDVIKNIE